MGKVELLLQSFLSPAVHKVSGQPGFFTLPEIYIRRYKLYLIKLPRINLIPSFLRNVETDLQD